MLICSALNTQGPIYPKSALCSSPSSSLLTDQKEDKRSSGKNANVALAFHL